MANSIAAMNEIYEKLDNAKKDAEAGRLLVAVPQGFESRSRLGTFYAGPARRARRYLAQGRTE